MADTRVLYVTDPTPDYLADQVYVGLSRVLGVEQVIDYPWKAVYHDPASRLPYLPQVPATPASEEAVAAQLRDGRIDLLVLSSPQAARGEAIARLQRKVPLPPTVLLDGEDDADIRHELADRFHCALYCKREYRWHPEAGARGRLDRWRAFRGRPELFHRTVPFPFSIIPQAVRLPVDGPRPVDLSYVVRASHPKRLRAWRIVQSATDLRSTSAVYAVPTDRQSKLLTGLPKLWIKLQGDPPVTDGEQRARMTFEAYHRLLRQSKMALSIRGGGFDTLRYWEIVDAKALLVSERPDICIPNNFEHGVHALFCKPDLSDLLAVLRPYVHDEAARTALAEAGHRHLLQFHTCDHRARYLLDLCRQHV